MATNTEAHASYALSNGWEHEEERLGLLEAVLDPLTFARLSALPVVPGWRCLEVGAGHGSVTRWLCDRVGPPGRVLATDIDPRFVAGIAHPALEVRRHDVRVDDFPAARFDLVHARAVLEHLPERDEVIGRLVRTLRPGGWLVVEDFDVCGIDLLGPGAYRQAMEAMFAEMAARGGSDYRWARHLAPRFAAHGLVDIRVEGQILFASGSSLVADLLELTWRQLLGDPDGDGDFDRSVLHAALAALRDPGTWASLPVVIGAVGRGPG